LSRGLEEIALILFNPNPDPFLSCLTEHLLFAGFIGLR
jgi:hypothetical protein